MIPRLEELGSDVLRHKHGDLFNQPGLTNFIGTVQVDVDPIGLRSVNFPPFGNGDGVTASLFLNGRYWPSLGQPVDIQWFPDKVVRNAEHDGIHIKSTTVLPFDVNAALIRIDITNMKSESRTIDLKLGISSCITKTSRPWNSPIAPSESDLRVELEISGDVSNQSTHQVHLDHSRNAIIHASQKTTAVQIQGLLSPMVRLSNSPSYVVTSFEYAGRETKTLWYLTVTGDDIKTVSSVFDGIASNPEGILQKVRSRWEHEIEAIFTPDNGVYSGHLPTLDTSDAEIRRIYHMGILGVTYFRRDNPASVYGRAYDTLMPKHWQTVTFIWDYHLSGVVHALLDPKVMTKYMNTWLKMDIHSHFGTEYLTGSPVGYWYGVNDYAIIALMRDYLRWTGDTAWLEKSLTLKDGTITSASDMLGHFAQHYHQFQTKTGLADYGGYNNLLECVSSYSHEVASLNAANIFNLRFAADVASAMGDSSKATSLLDEATTQLELVQKLYADGKGFWKTRYPNNETIEVRHVFDFVTILNTIPDSLSHKQKKEMVQFFVEELQTPTWMRALSPFDDNAMFSVRTDHQWNGAYPAWPPLSALGLFTIGENELAFNWLRGLAKSANQGPFGQAHFDECVMPLESGGSLKVSADKPYYNDWTCSSNGSWAKLIIEGLFGVKAGLKTIEAHPKFSSFDPSATLRGLRWQGKDFDVNRKGLVKK
jgi:hypothetical protein